MILDKLLQFDPSATAASTIVTTGVDSTNTLDLLNARDLAVSDDDFRLEAVFTVLTAMTASGGASSLIIQIKGSADNSTYYVMGQTDSGGIPKANLTAGQQIRVMLPSYQQQPQMALPRYIKCTYTAVTNNFTGGTFECDLMLDAQASNPPSYPPGIVVAN